MKKLFNIFVLTVALMLPYATFAQDESVQKDEAVATVDEAADSVDEVAGENDGVGGYFALSGDKANTDGRKNTDSLHLPHQLQGHFDFEEAVEDAKAQNKPIFVYVVGHACNNCREMETKVWSNDLVLTKLKEEFVICALYVDDNTEVKGGKRLGSINSKLARDKWNVNAQPAYIILSPDGETVLAGPRGYDTNVKAFVEFLDKGKNAASFEIIYDNGASRNIEWNITVEPKGKNLYEVTFDGTIKEGFHCYAMKDFSAPVFEFDNAEVVGDVVEPLTTEEHPDGFGGTSFCYYGKATYIYTIKAEAGTEVTGFVNATICSEDNMWCSSNVAEFVIRL